MLNTGKGKKNSLYNKFSQNLVHIKTYLGNDRFGEEHKSHCYICPLSFREYKREQLDEKSEDQLTAEHAPPDSLNGKKVALTAGSLNNRSGHLYDDKLLDYINAIEFKEGLSPLPIRFKINDNLSLRGEISKKEQVEFYFQTKTFHQGAERFFNVWKSKVPFNVNFSLPKIKRPDLAFLRTAYILAFSEVGYSLLFCGINGINKNMKLIREQLENPEALLIPDIPIFREEFPDDFFGVSLITHPKELRSVLVVFDLVTVNKKHRYGVLLPGPDAYGFKAYNFFKELISKKEGLKFEIQSFPKKKI